MKKNEFWLSLIGAVIAAVVIAIFVKGAPDKKIVYAIEYSGLIITFLFGFLILAAIASGKIDISKILDEKSAEGGTGAASMSRCRPISNGKPVGAVPTS